MSALTGCDLNASSLALQGVVDFFETLSPTTVEQMAQIYAYQATFIDPFNHVQGVPAITAIFEHMFTATQSPRFEVLSAFTSVDGSQAFLRWDFHFSKTGLGQDFCIHGSSYLRLDAQGKITYHQDYWDSGKELYSKMPIIGGLIRWLSKQMQTPQRPKV